MITLYTLNQSRSQRIAWLLEELAVDYHAEIFERDEQTKLAPPQLKAIHPLGKAPIITDDDKVLIESGAIVEYLINHYAKDGKLKPALNTPAYDNYLQWIHYAEGSIAFALVASMYAGEDFAEFCQGQIALHAGFVEGHLSNQLDNNEKWFVSDELTGADILMSFPLQALSLNLPEQHFPQIYRFVKQVETHPSYLKANERIGHLDLARLTS